MTVTHHVNILEMNGDSYWLDKRGARKLETETWSSVTELALQANTLWHAQAM